jgi:drug/metabolite transporter (DMT)-like permease
MSAPVRAGASAPLLFAVCTTIWGSTWLAITWQLGVVAPEVSVAYRFGLAALVLCAFCVASGRSLRFRASDHALFAAQGALMFAFSYVCIYWAEQHVVSGLVAVAFATFTFMNVFAERVTRGTPITARALAAATIGVAGVAVLFLPDIATARSDRATALGIAVALVGTLFATLGNMVASRVQLRGHAIIPATAWALAYGALVTALLAVLNGHAWAFDARPRYVAALLYLAIFGTIVAFVSYLALMRKVGMVRASYVGVCTPVIALALSAAVEGYVPTLYTVAGTALVIGGNLAMLRRRKPPGGGGASSR